MLGDWNDMTGYELVHGREGGDGFGVRIYIRRPPEVKERLAQVDGTPRPDHSLTPKEEEDSLFYRVGDEIDRLVHLQAKRLDPKTEERKRETRAKLRGCFEQAGLAPILMEELPNGYWGADNVEGLGDPWYSVSTLHGRIVIGWRKRVINIDWSACSGLGDGDVLFMPENVTTGPTMVHAWGYEKAAEYLRTLTQERTDAA